MIVLYILLALLVFGIMILVHELGHFLVARACHVTVNEFSIGMGPKLISWIGKRKKNGEKRDAAADSAKDSAIAEPLAGKTSSSGATVQTTEGADRQSASAETADSTNAPDQQNPDEGTRYSLRLLPIGGYVSMAGEDEESNDPDAFNHKNVWQRIAITVAGGLMNIVLGFLATLLLVGLTGNFLNTTVRGFYRDEGNTPTASESFLQVNDKILSVNGKKMHNFTEIAYEIMYNGYEPVNMVVERNGEKVLLDGVQFAVQEEKDVKFGIVDFGTYNEKKTPWTLLKNGFYSTVSQIRMLWETLIDLLKGRFGFNAVSGPVGVVGAIGQTAKAGFSNLLSLFAFITLNLGVFNLLPIPALDGGRLVFLLIEAVSRKKVPAKVEATIHGVGMIVLLAFMFVVSVKDVIMMFL